MARGTWTTQNKVRPGVYVNSNSEPKPLGSVGERGIVTMALALNWGEAKKIQVVEAGENTFSKLGYAMTDVQMLLIREALKRAKTLLLYRLNAGVKATATVGELTMTAKHGGTRGNDITVTIRTNLDDNTKFDVLTFVGGQEVEVQTVADSASLKNNDWVVFTGTGALVTTAGTPLTGGANGTVTNADHLDYLTEAEVHDFDTMALISTDNTLKSLYTSFCERLREDEGRKFKLP